ncbi:MAG: DNA-3-methyladenine glycosylase [Oscillospiraceae bacterium]|nr:DNA-3-methyladenine glycosylase [Oscillospiraceae bacterium]
MKLARDFYEGDTLSVARGLIGCVLFRRTEEGVRAGRIVEAEAYLGPADDAAHSYRGYSRRVRVQYEGSGLAYIYMIYGLHWCFNITSGPADAPEAILIRALEPLEGLSLMAARRGTEDPKKLCSGPGKLCQALDIGMELYGEDLTVSDRLWLEPGDAPASVAASKRVGVEYAVLCRDRPWRFYDPESRCVSVKMK